MEALIFSDNFRPERGSPGIIGLSPHLDSVAEANTALQMKGEPLARICGSYGLFCHYRYARFNLAEPLMHRALDIDEKSYVVTDGSEGVYRPTIVLGSPTTASW